MAMRQNYCLAQVDFELINMLIYIYTYIYMQGYQYYSHMYRLLFLLLSWNSCMS